MNADRRSSALVCVALIEECAESGTMSDSTHNALCGSVKAMKAAEYWSLRNQEKHEGANERTDTSIAISRVALPALEKAADELCKEDPDYILVIDQLRLAATTDGTVPKKRRAR